MHLMVASPPVFRINGQITPQTDFPPLSQKDLEHYFEIIATLRNKETPSIGNWNWILPIAFSGLARFRVSVLKQRGTMGFTFRAVCLVSRLLMNLNSLQYAKN